MSEINQKDLVLSINEYAFVLDKTKGNVACWVGPVKTSLSQSDALVEFNDRTKKFEECNMSQATKLFLTAPENWYIILKNPTQDGRHPQSGTSNSLPEGIKVGCKVNLTGPTTFALYPGQMAKVVKGHTLRSNQYLLARVYDATNANTSCGTALDAEGKPIQDSKNTYITGQLLVIKGTEVSFYMPPTGIEVIAVKNSDKNGYVRDAVTLERLEYCILKDEDGNKRYVHGPEVVFPEPTETFVTSPKGGLIFRAIELSKISGIYVKVIAEYADDDGTIHPVGEELFITGDKQMIYYPRPEHAIINYDNKILHHAVAIPAGEGRYVMDRLTGIIKTIHGPAMYLPDPRFEVVVKRKLTPNECNLWYPGNKEVYEYNAGLNEKAVETALKKSIDRASASYCVDNSVTSMDSLSREENTLAYLETNAGISRGTSYTKPRTIVLDNKFDGVVSVDVWTGYAVNVISKDGTRKVVCGPQTVALDYDQTFEVLQLSSGKPKTTDNIIQSVFLHYEKNKVSDVINVETKDFVNVDIKVSYCVDFLPEYKDKWFSVENFVKYLCDRQRSLIKQAVKNFTIEEFYQNYSDIIRNVALNEYKSEEKSDSSYHGRFFKENGMLVYDVEILQLVVEDEIEDMLLDHQHEMVKKSLELSNAEKRVKVAEELAIAEKKEADLNSETLIHKMLLKQSEAQKKLEIQSLINRMTEAEQSTSKSAEDKMQVILDSIHDAEKARKMADREADIKHAQDLANIEKEKQEAYAATVSKIIESIGPDLVAALTSNANANMLSTVSEAIGPYAIAQGSSIADTVNKLLRGTSLENLVDGVTVNAK